MIDRLVIIRGELYQDELVQHAAAVLKSHGVLVHPTETMHGYGCRYDSPGAIERINLIKGREENKPLVLLIPGTHWVERLCLNVSRLAWRLTELFWPGPLTIVFEAAECLSEKKHWQRGTVALRQERNPFTAQALKKLDLPVVSTSLNRPGEPVEEPVRYLEKLALEEEKGSGPRVELAVIDEELTVAHRQPSTIVSVIGEDRVRVIREGALPAGEIAEKAGVKTER